MNHPNYARWAVRYYENLINLPKTHPEVFDDFKKGWFAIKRTEKPFSATPIDLTLEQTINADAASQKIGISSMTNSISARQRWSQSHYLRTAIISDVYEELGMTKKDDLTKDLKTYKVKKDNADFQKVRTMIRDTMNPFDNNIGKEYLFNLGTSKAASKETETFLLNMESIGEEERKRFVSECIENEERFEKPIKRQKVRTFATQTGKRKMQGSDGKVVASCFVRDLFGTLCYSLERKVDMALVLTYPLTPVPLSLCHVDGTMLSTQKSSLLKHLEEKVVTTPPVSVDVTIIDAMFFLHQHTNLPSNFGDIAQYILMKILQFRSNIIHFVTDKWVSPSIKDCERQERESTTFPYEIKGPGQRRPSNWALALKNVSFKNSLIKFLIEIWEDDTFSNILLEKTLYANYNDVCYKYTSENGKMKHCEAEEYYSTHEEADNRMFFHISNITTPSNVVIRTNDTDSLVIAIGCGQMFNENIKIWLDVSLQFNNSQRYISVFQIRATLGERLSKSLLAFHAFTGCDYDASFSRRGKVAPFELLVKDERTQDAFCELGNDDGFCENNIAVIEKFVCAMYGKRKFALVDEVRSQIFLDKYRPRKKDYNLSCVKKLDGTMMPPCSIVLLQKIRQTRFVTRKWSSAPRAHPPNDSPQEWGWNEQDGKLMIHWFDGEPAPASLNVVCLEDENIDENEEMVDTTEYYSESDDDDEDEDDTSYI